MSSAGDWYASAGSFDCSTRLRGMFSSNGPFTSGSVISVRRRRLSALAFERPPRLAIGLRRGRQFLGILKRRAARARSSRPAGRRSVQARSPVDRAGPEMPCNRRRAAARVFAPHAAAASTSDARPGRRRCPRGVNASPAMAALAAMSWRIRVCMVLRIARRVPRQVLQAEPYPELRPSCW